ncbi:phosphatase PAP2 family protein [Mumia sp. zg.B53]|uniref:phosphatase PAP2 family protein n=1 Tax=unclassified Mumia TaxID=2621872 RepID=UPI001C6E2E50|nr:MULTISPECIES: phosphatase PAP2 family protein [unclassified Mumia]MBW9207716.1 phosphatase PAP2 family protein [Mumia sp. zg.B17]MBW9209938.1 phosphatase PAP2 family protein [Mumia sp. zg.B21]MBW9214542.1 phosphatase PAP2 family protein [Mumia sp. zg.B53]MDD9347663.1 phosphatase PAP2 family protein [Mumia sp.]
MASPTISRAPSAGRAPGRAKTVAAALCLLTLSFGALVVTVSYLLDAREGQRVDQAAMDAVYARRDALDQLLSVLGYLSIGTMATAIVVLVSMAALRQRFAAAVGAVAVVAAANITTQVLKRVVLDRPDHGYGWHVNSLPSGHTTAAVSLVVAALLVAPLALRGLVVLVGTGAIVLTGVSTVVAGWHRPSDVLAALAVGLFWGAAVVLVLALRRAGPSSGTTVGSLFFALVGAAVAGAVLLGLGVRPYGGWSGVAPAALVMALIGVATALSIAVFARISSVFAR